MTQQPMILRPHAAPVVWCVSCGAPPEETHPVSVGGSRSTECLCEACADVLSRTVSLTVRDGGYRA